MPLPHHSWRDCRPILLADPDTNIARRQQLDARLVEVWADINDEERRLFHEFACLNARTPDHMALVSRLAALLRAEEAR